MAAEEETESGGAGKAEPKHSVRFLPVGDAPPFRQEVRDGVRHELEPPAGSIPPREVMIETTPEETLPCRLRLGQTSQAVWLPPKLRSVTVKADGGREWLRCDLTEARDHLVVVWRDVARGSWLEPRHMVVANPGLGEGMLRVVNTTGSGFRIVVGAGTGRKDQVIAAGRQVVVATGAGDGIPLQVFQAGGAARPFYSTRMVMNPGERGIVLLYSYRAERLAGKLAAKVMLLRDRVPSAAAAEPPLPRGGFIRSGRRNGRS